MCTTEYNCTLCIIWCHVVFDCVWRNEYSWFHETGSEGRNNGPQFKGLTKDLIAKLKAVAALDHASLKDYVATVLQHHVDELEKKGLLPKGK